MAEIPLDGIKKASFTVPMSEIETRVTTNDKERKEEKVAVGVCLAELDKISRDTIEDYVEKISLNGELVEIKIGRIKKFFNEEGGRERVLSFYRDFLSEESEITSEKQSLLKGHLSFILQRAIDQDLNSPGNYVSHEFKHSLHVVNYLHQEIETYPWVIEDMAKKYNMSLKQTIFLVENLGIFHDFGYPKSELEHMPKVKHSVNGAEVINEGETEIDGQKVPIRDVLAGIFGGREIVDELRDAVLLHNADKNDQEYTAKIFTKNHGRFLVQASDVLRALDYFGDVTTVSIFSENAEEGEKAKEKLEHDTGNISEDKRPRSIRIVNEKYPGRNLKDNFLGLEFFKVSLEENPLLALIRTADNMDMVDNRRSYLQGLELFKYYYYALVDKNGFFYEPNKNVEDIFRLTEREKDDEKKKILLKSLKKEVALDMATYQISHEQENNEETINTKFLNNIIDLPEQAEEIISSWRRFIVDRLAREHELEPRSEIRSQVRRVAAKMSSVDSPHFLGCEPIRKVQMTKQGIEVTVDKELYDELNKIIIEEELVDSNGQISILKIPAGQYQIKRLYYALEEIILDPNRLKTPIFVNGVEYHPNSGYKSDIIV